MKKRTIITVLLMVMLVLLLAACGGSKEDESLYGTYELFAVEQDGMKFETAGIMDGSLTLEKGGKGTLILDDETSIKWSCDGNQLTVKKGLSKVEGTIDNGNITLDADGSIMYFVSKNAGSKSNTENEDKDEGAEVSAEDTSAAASNEYHITAYTANDQTYSDPELLKQLGMDETYMTMNDDHTGVLCISGECYDINWSDDGQISVSTVPLYSFEREGADCIILNMYDTIYYRLERGKGSSSSAKKVQEPAEDEPEEIFVETDDGDAVDPDHYVVVDNEYIKIVVVGKGVFEYNEDWMGYTLELSNKTDQTIGFSSRAEALEDWNDSFGGGDTCMFGGVKTGTHFEMMLNPGIMDYNKSVLAIDGVTSLDEVKDVSGYFFVWNNETDEIIGNYPYHFK